MIDLKKIAEQYPDCLKNRLVFNGILEDQNPNAEVAEIKILTDSVGFSVCAEIQNAKTMDTLLVHRLCQRLEELGYTHTLSVWCIKKWMDTFCSDTRLLDDEWTKTESAPLQEKGTERTKESSKSECFAQAWADENVPEETDLSAFSIEDGVLLKYLGTFSSIVVPKTIRKIGERAFEGSGISEIYLPNGLAEIGDSAFFWCSRLAKVSLPSSLCSIGEQAFQWCGTNIPAKAVGDKSSSTKKKGVLEIEYRGTKESWKRVVKMTDWKKSATAKEIRCIDGVGE